jgi:hypothetical protein
VDGGGGRGNAQVDDDGECAGRRFRLEGMSVSVRVVAGSVWSKRHRNVCTEQGRDKVRRGDEVGRVAEQRRFGDFLFVIVCI